MIRTIRELRRARTHSTRRGGTFRRSARLAALTLLGLGIGLGNGGFAAAGNAGAHLAPGAGLVMVTPRETAERVQPRLAAGRPHPAAGIVGEGRGCARKASTSAPNKVLVLRAMHTGSACGMGPTCSATKLYATDNKRKSALSTFSPRNRTTGGRDHDRTAKR